MAAAIEEIHKFSGGVPRVINLLCDRTLTIGFRQEMKRVGTDCVVEGADELGLTPARMDGINGKAVDFAAATRV
jgi:hypothetical protein